MVYQGPERRNIGREETPIEEHAHRAAKTRFLWNPETERAEDNNGHTILTASFDGGINFRELLIAAAFDQKVRPEASIQSEAEVFAQYELYLDGIKLPPLHMYKLKEMMRPANYQIAVQAAKEIGPATKVPTYEKIAAEVMKLQPERLKEICAIQEKPTLVIVVPNSFEQKLAAINSNKHYKNGAGRPQQDLKCDLQQGSPYKDTYQMVNGKVSIVDGIPNSKQVTDVPPRLGIIRSYLIVKFAANKMRLIDKDELATLVQQSLIEAQAKDDNSRIVDNWENGKGTSTIIDPQTLSQYERYVSYYFFSSINRRPYFRYFYPDRIDDRVSGRAGLQLMEF